ncbi:MAG: RNA polymerase sigma-70 factor [Bacteroidetes bacterium]|nr:MAG: RNA polymerase sigma-70 factor [Bacteroidota bacterium]
MIEKPNISLLNKVSFEDLFKTYFKPLTAFAFKFVNDIDEAKSIVHDVFVKLWEKRDDIDMTKSVKSYLYTSVNNRSLNFIRDNKKFNRNENVFDNQSSSAPNVEEELSSLEIQKKIDASLNSLNPKVKRIFEMSRYEGLKYKEIAEELNLSVKTVETHMSTALKVLRENLKEYLTVILLLILNN